MEVGPYWRMWHLLVSRVTSLVMLRRTPLMKRTLCSTIPIEPLGGRATDASSNNSSQSSSTSDEKKLRQKIHAAVLLQVPKYGWTTAAVHAAITALGLSPASSTLLPAGIEGAAVELEADLKKNKAVHLYGK